jgi:hypothetical protein
MRIPTEAMMSAVYGVWDRYGVRDVSEVDRDILRESLVAAIDSLLTEDTDK